MYDKEYYDNFKWNNYYFINTAILKQVLEIPNNAKVLDVGCGVGFHVAGFIKNGLDAHGCDFSPIAIEKAKNDIDKTRFVVADIRRRLPYEDKEFDVVTCFDVFEHLDYFDIISAIKELRRISKKWVIIQTLFKDEEHHKELFEKDNTHKIFESKQWWLDKLEIDKYGYFMKPFEIKSPKGIILKFPHPDQIIITTSTEMIK